MEKSKLIKSGLVSVILASLLTGCGGGGGSSSSGNDTTTGSSDTSSGTTTSSITIIPADGYIYGASMTCENGATATIGDDNLTFTVDSTDPGTCTVTGGAHLIDGEYVSNDATLNITVDEATNGETLYATPLTSLVSASVKGGESIGEAKKKVASLMGVDPDNSSDVEALLEADPTKLTELTLTGEGNDFDPLKARTGMVSVYTMMEQFSSAGATTTEIDEALSEVVASVADGVTEPSEELNASTIVSKIGGKLNKPGKENQFSKISDLLVVQEDGIKKQGVGALEDSVESAIVNANKLEETTKTDSKSDSIATEYENLSGSSDSSSGSDTTSGNDSSDSSTDNDTSSGDSSDTSTGTDSSSGDSSSTTTYSFKVVDTNQDTCYNSSTGKTATCSGTGYDADYSGNQPSYSVSESGNIVTDNVTGIMWTQSSDIDGDGVTTDEGDKKSYADAITYCSNLSLDGYDDWRVPDIKTLYSLILFSGEDPSSYTGTDTSGLKTFLDESFTKAFGDQDSNERIIDGQYATTTKYVHYTMSGDETMFGVNFVDGRIKGYPLEAFGSDKLFYVLCARGNESYGVNSFTDNGDETITDSATGLMWQKDDSQSTDFDNAITTCENATTAGHSDWRLPNVKELHSITDYSKSPDTTNSAAIDNIFNSTSFVNEEGETDWGYYWSSTTHATSGGSGSAGSYVSFGRALGYMNEQILDVHGAGAQRSNSKSTEDESGSSTATDTQGATYSYKGPQGDILRIDNMVRCVRDASTSASTSSSSDDTTTTDTSDTSSDATASVSDGYVLYSLMGEKTTQLMDNDKNVVKTWTSDYRTFSSAYLTDTYTLVRAGQTTNAANGTFADGGSVGGIIQEFDTNGNVIWEFTKDDDSYTLHHDFKQIDSDNILALAWELREVDGKNYWNEKIIKIEKSTKTIVWEWDAITDGGVTPTSSEETDFIHLNSIDYKNGEILVSARTKNELWVINESSKAITKTLTGGSSLSGQHDATFLDNGNILAYNNSETKTTSAVVEIDPSSDTVTWEYANTFYSNHISGTQRLSNGNTLICSGTEGTLIEVSTDGTEVWTATPSEGKAIFKVRKYASYQ